MRVILIVSRIRCRMTRKEKTMRNLLLASIAVIFAVFAAVTGAIAAQVGRVYRSDSIEL